MRIVFRVDASLKMGIGHVMRCLTLANEFKLQNHEIFFICRELPGNLISLIKYPVLVLPNNEAFHKDDLYLNWLGASQERDLEQTIKVIPKNTDLVIVDNYALDEIWHKSLRLHTKKLMVIDDLADRKFDCDILLNQNLGTQILEYSDKVPNDCELLLGCDFALLRPEFQLLREKALAKRKKTKEIKNILISLGGVDLSNKAYSILEDIPDYFNVVVILGGHSQHNEMIINYAKNKKNVNVMIDADNISRLMLDADLAIGAGGSTSWERCCLGLPTLLYVLAENQRKIAESLEKLGAVKIVDNLNENLQNLLNNFTLWQTMSEKAQIICDGAGVKRIKI